MKAKQIKIYSFGRSNIKDGVITSEKLEDNEITLTESFLTIAFECYKNVKLEDGQLIDEIIKVMLPGTELTFIRLLSCHCKADMLVFYRKAD